MDVLENEQQGRVAGQRHGPVAERLDDQALLRIRCQIERRVAVGGGDRQGGGEQGRGFHHRHADRLEIGFEPIELLIRRVGGGESGDAGELVGDRIERGIGVIGRALEGQHVMRLGADVVPDRLDQARLADAGLAAQGDHLAFTVERALPAIGEHRHFGIAADQGADLAGVRRRETPFRRADADHARDRYRLDDALERMFAKLADFESPAENAPRRRRDGDLIGSGEPLDAGGDIGRLADRQFGNRGIARAGLADHHRAGGDADADLQRRRGGDILDRANDVERGAHRPLGAVLVGDRPAEIGHQAVAEILRDVAVIALDHPTAHALVRRHEITQVSRIELFGQRRRAHQVAEHHGDLAPLGLARRWRGHRVEGIERGDRFEQLLAMAKTKPERLQVRLGECAQNLGVDVVLLEQLGVLGETEVLEPGSYVHASSCCPGLA